ncbi:MAG: hypothetical protein LBO81_01840, partial [Clostridiales Family XIII bacterium]|nr:hypothetical protein [Clostridiales Family XIII bacterium]
MAKTPIYMPKFGMTMTRAEITGWYVKEGDKVTAGMPILSIETEKTNVDVEAPADGYVTKPLFAEGDEAEVGAILLYVAETLEEARSESDADGTAVGEPQPGQAPVLTETVPAEGEALSGIRKRIAENMRASLQNSAQLTHMRTVEADAFCAWKESLSGVSLTDLFVKQFAV